MVTSLLTIVAVLVVMFIISWLLALIALVTVPLSIFIATKIGKRAQPNFVDQWRTTGQMNGHIEEMYTGHSLVKLFGRRHEAEAVFRQHNESLYQSSFKAQFVSGLIQPAMTLIGNINYVFVAVIGGLQVASGQLSLGAVQAFIQYSRQFSQPISQVASMANMLQSGVASAERVFALLDATEQDPDDADARPLPVVRGEVAFEDVSFSYFPDQPLIEGLSLAVAPGETVAIVGPTGAGKTTLVNLLMRFYEVDKGRITLDGVDIASLTARSCARRRAWCCKTRGSSVARSPRTSPTARRGRRTRRSSPPRKRATSTTSCARSLMATTPFSMRRARACRRESASSSRSLGPSSRNRRSSSSTRRRARSTRAPKCSSSARWLHYGTVGRALSSRIGSRRSAMPISSW